MKTLSVRRPIGERGQVVVPKDIREFLNLRPGGNVVFTVHDGNVVLKRDEPEANFVAEFLNTPKLKKLVSAAGIKRLILEEHGSEIR
jgi:AbrB family looped-hinge helix DNA binding protein